MVALIQQKMAELAIDDQRPREAVEIYQSALDVRRRVLPEDHPDIGLTLIGMGRATMMLGDPAAAEVFLQEGLAVLERSLPERDERRLQAMVVLGQCLLRLERFEDAESLLRRRDELSPDEETKEILSRLHRSRDEPGRTF